METVIMIKDKWWFYDETWTQLFGPFDERKQCSAACRAYALSLFGETDEQLNGLYSLEGCDWKSDFEIRNDYT